MGERTRLTESVAGRLEALLTERGRDLSKPHDVWDEQAPGLLLRREASGRKTWYLKHKASGRWTRMALGTWPSLGVQAARDAAKVQTAKAAMGGDPVADRRAQRAQARRAKAVKLGAFVDDTYAPWAEAHLRGHKETLQALRRDFRCWWDRPMDGITAMDVERWRTAQLKRGVSKATCNREWGRVRAVLGKANEWGLIGPPVKVRLLKTDSARTRYLSTEERPRLLAALDARELRRRDERHRMNAWLRARGEPELPEHGAFTDHLRPLVLLALNTGLRRGELLKLQWGAIDFQLGRIRVQASTAKSGKTRSVPMTATARSVLEALHEQQRPKLPPADPKVVPIVPPKTPAPPADAYLFTRPDGERLQSLDSSWARVLEEAGITDFKFHDLRHCFASQVVGLGHSLQVVSELLGHADVRMSARYAHITPEYLANVMAQFPM